MENTAKFLKTNSPDRMAVRLTYCGFFVSEIKRRTRNYRWLPDAKVWVFDAGDYRKVRDLIVESFPKEGITITEIDGTVERIQGEEEHRLDSYSEFVTAVVKNIYGDDLSEVEF
jgi:hypothetical protein